MFNQLGERLTEIVKKLRGHGHLTEENIQESLREVRHSLLEADVALQVVNEFLDRVKEKALGKKVLTSVNPGQALVKLVNDELIHALGETTAELNLSGHKPIVFVLAGLQGSGKTTSAAKLAKLLKKEQEKNEFFKEIKTTLRKINN